MVCTEFKDLEQSFITADPKLEDAPEMYRTYTTKTLSSIFLYDTIVHEYDLRPTRKDQKEVPEVCPLSSPELP